jgi:hypothetical protein
MVLTVLAVLQVLVLKVLPVLKVLRVLCSGPAGIEFSAECGPRTRGHQALTARQLSGQRTIRKQAHPELRGPIPRGSARMGSGADLEFLLIHPSEVAVDGDAERR